MKVLLPAPVATRPAVTRSPATGPAVTPSAMTGSPVIGPAVTPSPATRSAVTRVAWRRAVLAAAGAGVVAAAVAGCTGGSASSVFTPTPQISATSHSGTVSKTPSPSGSATSTGRSSASASATSKPTASDSPTATRTASARPTATPSATHRTTPTHRATPTHQATHAATPPATHFPVGAPQTGGGGTAGLQDVSLFGIGGAAILVGIASLTYRRRLSRKRRTNGDNTPSTPTHAGTH